MCGIVGYFGSAGNNLTRPLTAMAAMVYRAPDSTGIGFFGDDTESIRTRKSVGPVRNLLALMLDEKAYPNAAVELMSLWQGEAEKTTVVERQRRLLTFEGFSTEILDALLRGEMDYPSVDDLVDVSESSPRTLSAGWPGRPAPPSAIAIRSRDDLGSLINHLVRHHDLSFLAVQTLLRRALSHTLDTWQEEGRIELDPVEILNAFDGVLTQTYWEQCMPKPGRLEYECYFGSPYVEKILWGLLSETRIHIPSDYDRDGVRCIFRLLDGALLCRLPHRPKLQDQLQQVLETLWHGAEKHSGLDWKTLYWAEKGVNVYGWAAASALAHLQQKLLLPELLSDSTVRPALAENLIPGQTDPLSLKYFSPPIIAQGRWALQSPVTPENGHPFLDDSGQRAIVLNGQFNSEVESEVHDFLERVAGCSFGSQNSSEYFALLWGYYSRVLQEEKNRFQAIRFQIDSDWQGYSVGSQAIDYKVYQQVEDKSPSELDEMAFLEAAKRMLQGGGEIAVAGISLQSPRRLYVASHDRPVFVVQRTDGDDFMVVSDVNAAMGLFSQAAIHEKALELGKLRREYLEGIEELQEGGGDKEDLEACETNYEKAQSSILKYFEVLVYPLEGEEIFARIEAGFTGGNFRREVHITDFSGTPLPEVKSFRVALNPLQTRKDLFSSFYESHLHEIPERLNDILRTYARDENSPPHFNLGDHVLHRRFGHGYIRLKRILLVGMGSAHNAGLMARDFLQTLLPEVEILVLRPIEIENITNTVVPENDLVVLLSWSSTTADMVRFAKDLEAHQVAMLGITEKRFADMALIAHKSAGVIQTLTGEEVTIAAIKSTVCMLFCLELFALCLASRLGRKKEPLRLLERLRQVPGILAQVLNDNSVEDFAKELAAKSGRSYAALVFDALESTATGHEIASKLEENSWSAVGKCLDYRDLLIHGCKKDLNQHLVLVNATHEGRLREALNVMKKLYLGGVPFAAVSYGHADKAEVDYFSNKLSLDLPKIEDTLQPFVDLVFYYLFAYHYGLAHGRAAEDAPRNRSKSVTVGKGRPKKIPSPATELLRLEEKKSQLVQETAAPLQQLSRETIWEQDASFERERLYYKNMRRLAEAICQKDPAETLLQLSPEDSAKLTKAIFEDLPEEGEIVFVSLDRSGHAAAKNVAARWQRFLKYFMRVAPGGESLKHFKEDAILIFVATTPPEDKILSGLLQEVFVPCLWLGPAIPEEAATFFRNSLGYLTLNNRFRFIENDLLYAGLSSLLLAAWKESRPDKAHIVEEYFRKSSRVVQAILHDESLRQALFEAMAANKKYRSACFSGPPGGIGLAWVDRFDQVGCLFLEHHLYGESGFGPLGTVDPQVDKKFVHLGSRSEMVSVYGEKRVSAWERRYLARTDVDTFLQSEPEDLGDQVEKPFFAERRWYLPVLNPDYDPTEDNLIIIDATSERHFDHALDELATYGARYARVAVVTQGDFLKGEGREALQNYPISHLLALPALEGDSEPIPIPDLLLPFVMNLMSMGLAAAAAQIRALQFEPLSLERIFRENFGPLGEVMSRHRMDLDYFNHRLIDSMKNLAPVVSTIEGIGRYMVRQIRQESELLQLAGKQHLNNPEKTIEHFRTQEVQEVPFYLLCPDRETFEGRVLQLASRTFNEEEWNLWHEAYGETWWVLYSRTPSIRQSSREEPLLMLPFGGGSRRDGWLYHLYLRYADWDHSAPVEEQLRITTEALGKESIGQDNISSRYREIVSHFNAKMTARKYSWDDRLLILVKRPLLFSKPSREVVEILVERGQELLDLSRPRRGAVDVEQISQSVEKAWPTLQGKESLNDKERWDAIGRVVGDFL